MKLEIFLPKVKQFFDQFNDYLIKKKQGAEASGGHGKTGNIRVATLNLLAKAQEKMQSYIDNWSVERINTIVGQLSAIKPAIAQLKNDDRVALALLQKVGAIFTKYKGIRPKNIETAIVTHKAMAEETDAIALKADEIISDLAQVNELQSYSGTPADALFDAELLKDRETLIKQYEQSLEKMEERFQERQNKPEAPSQPAVKPTI